MNRFDTVLAFGDSFSSQCGTSRNEESGELEVNRRTWTDFKSGLYGNPIFNDCSVNGGLNYLNFLTNCTENGIDPLTCPTRLVDLSFGGAQASPAEHSPVSDIVMGEGQLENWADHVRPHLTFDPSKTLVSMFYGLNDLTVMKDEGFAQILEDDGGYITELEISRRVDWIERSMTSLYDDGLRHFLIFNVPLDISGVAALILEWNRLLELAMAAFRAANPASMVYVMDTFTLNNKVYGTPEVYGLTETSAPCYSKHVEDASFDCSETSTYFKMDWIHWTPRAHVILSDAVEEMMQTYETMPSSSGILYDSESSIDMTLYRIKSTVMDNSVAAIAILVGVSVIGLLTLFFKFYMRLRGKTSTKTSNKTYTRIPGGSHEEIELQDHDLDTEEIA